MSTKAKLKPIHKHTHTHPLPLAPIVQPVTIKDSKGTVDTDPAQISKSNKDSVTWISDGTNPATILFPPDASPFADSTFHVPAGGSVSSGPATASAMVGGILGKGYKYTVRGKDKENDPIIQIDP